ncbi:DDE-type integrase/transposase/recombinase [Nocardioides panacis]|uniref:DDE-type integrase/transposase/recombinase n=1 Tax=Nocardioides panacis TaxID=2849501 RepID=A0A975XZS4_9ACTN|nr:DDE-type integrase/transposase/recombinase [Nocardioides panacis]QWZ07715.1 DDE-type integrase/transposase/recombinase [Nocardioides panacis]
MSLSPVTGTAPDLKEAVLATLLRIKDTEDEVSNEDVRRAAKVMGVHERTVRRMVARGYVHKPRDRWEPNEEFTEMLVRGQGSIARIHETLTERGDDPGCHVRTMQRYAEKHYDQRVLAGARGGYEALRAGLPTLDRHYEHINDEWAMDHTKLQIWCLMPDGTIEKPWMTTIIDAASRMILACTVGPYTPSIEEDVETIAVAGVGWIEDEVRVGGQPVVIRSDRGGDLVSRAMTVGLLKEGTRRKYAEAYHPNQNGMIERWHRTIKEELVPFIEGRDRKKWTPSDPRTASVPSPADQVLPPRDRPTQGSEVATQVQLQAPAPQPGRADAVRPLGR